MHKFMLLAMGMARLMNQATDGGNGGGGAAGAGGAGTQGASTSGQAATGGNAGQSQSSGAGEAFAFVPESLRNEGWVNKYKTPEEFWKGVDSTIKMVGAKEIKQVQGIEVPGEKATDEDWAKFHQAIGRPEAADKYTYGDDLKAFEGMDMDAEKKGFSEAAFKMGLTQKQADGLFREYLNRATSMFSASQQKAQLKFDEALMQTFGNDHAKNLDLAKKGAKALSDGDKIVLEEISNPVTLKALAKLGEYVGEDSFHNDASTTSSKDALIEEAKRIQKSPEYRTKPELWQQVNDIYKKVYG
jgi:hypothetical protein